MDARLGFEPRLHGSKPRFLPLEDRATKTPRTTLRRVLSGASTLNRTEIYGLQSRGNGRYTMEAY